VIVQLEAQASSGGISGSVRHGPKEELQKQAALSTAKLMKIASVYEKPVGGKVKLRGKATPKAKLFAVVPTSSNVGLWKKMQIGTKTMEEGAACVPFGTVVVKNENPFPPCFDETSLDSVKPEPKRVNFHGSSYTKLQFPDGIAALIVEVCYDAGSQCYGLMIPMVDMKIVMYLQIATTPHGKNIDSENDIANQAEKQKVLASFNRQIGEINHAIEVYRSTPSPLPKKRKSEVVINMDDYQSNSCTQKHEETHATQKYLRLQNALTMLKKTDLPQCQPALQFGGMTPRQIQQSILQIEDHLQARFREVVEHEEDVMLNTDEIEAHQVHRDALKRLIDKIKDHVYPK
jgi:hypothetical protein